MNRQALPAALALLAMLALPGCMFSYGQFDPFNHGEHFDEAHKRFTQLVRWGRIDAASAFVTPELVPAFLEDAASLQEVRISDYEVLAVDVDDLKSATVEVLFSGYGVTSMVERSIVVTQIWQRDEEGAPGWRVRPRIAELRAFGGVAP